MNRILFYLGFKNFEMFKNSRFTEFGRKSGGYKKIEFIRSKPEFFADSESVVKNGIFVVMCPRNLEKLPF